MTTMEIVPTDNDAAPVEAARPSALPAQAEPSTGDVVADPRLDAIEARLMELVDTLGSTGAKVEAIDASAAAAAAQAAAVESQHQSMLTAASEQQTLATARLDAIESSLAAAEKAAAAASGRVDTLTERTTAIDARLDAWGTAADTLSQRATEHDKALADVRRSIAAEVERHTSDALVESQHRLQLAVNSIAQLALAMAESSTDITGDLSAESATALLESFKVDLDAILSQLGFEALGTTVGDTFDPHRHRALKRNPTPDPKHDKAITRVIRDGYRNAATHRILLFADVEVSRHRP